MLKLIITHNLWNTPLTDSDIDIPISFQQNFSLYIEYLFCDSRDIHEQILRLTGGGGGGGVHGAGVVVLVVVIVVVVNSGVIIIGVSVPIVSGVPTVIVVVGIKVDSLDGGIGGVGVILDSLDVDVGFDVVIVVVVGVTSLVFDVVVCTSAGAEVVTVEAVDMSMIGNVVDGSSSELSELWTSIWSLTT